jgi:hypothetical protein
MRSSRTSIQKFTSCFLPSSTILQHETTYDLCVQYLLFQLCRNDTLITPAIELLKTSSKYPWGGAPLQLLAKQMIFPYFCAGETIEDCRHVVDRLQRSGVSSLIDHSVEECGTPEEWMMNVENKKKLLHNCSTQLSSRVAFVPVKATSMMSPTLLETMTAIIRQHGKETYVDEEYNPIPHLTTNERAELDVAHNNLSKVCHEAQLLNIPILLDAEQSHRQPGIDYVCRRLQRQFNANADNADADTIVYNTYQMYMKCSGRRIQRDLRDSVQNGYRMGAKVVRGAYLSSEAARTQETGIEYPLWENRHETDINYNQSVLHLLESIANGSHASLLIATHNRSSVEHAIKSMTQHQLVPNHSDIHFAQILGMCDVLTLSLGALGYNAHKLLLYGDFDEVFPWLLRRLDENRDMMGAAQMELPLVHAELKRRLIKY